MNCQRFLQQTVGATLIMAFLVGCGSLAPELPTATPYPTYTSATPIISKTITSNHPLDVQIHLDSANSISQTVTPAGGTLEATAQDGTRYTLTIPKGALIEAQVITMTPVSRIDNLPLKSESLAALQLAPEGLNLMEPATLVIEPRSPIPLEELVSFAYQGDGKDLHLSPLSGNPADTTFEVWHFSGYGTGQGKASDIQKYTPSSAESDAASKATDIFRDSWLNRGGDISDDDEAKLCDISLDWYNASVIGNLKSAETDSSKLYAAGAEYMRWLREVQRFCKDTLSAQVAAANQSLARGLQHAYHEAAPKCECTLMVQWSRYATQLGLLSLVPDLTWDPNVKEDIKKCQVFELEIGGSVTLVGKTPITLSIPKGTVQLKRAGPTTFSGSKVLDAFWSGIDCPYSAEPTMTFDVQAENEDELVHRGSIFEFTITITGDWTTAMTCGSATGSFSKMATAETSFQLPARAGASGGWESPGFKEGSILFTLRDPNNYLEQVGDANWE